MSYFVCMSKMILKGKSKTIPFSRTVSLPLDGTTMIILNRKL